ncbi:MAG TPA: patatin-like phospholipase family protein [Clostridia bacterium]|nr:patatin-like phospholipase family protein [Clostridia bacterium]
MNKLLSKMKLILLRKPRLGLALSGGGARGLAHIGVLKALEEAGIQPDYLAGTSMGGVIAAAYAAGLKPDEIEQIATDTSRPRNLLRLAGLSLPQQGIFRGERLLTFFEQHLQGRTFAELQIPLTLVAVDLNTGQEVRLREGSVAQALRATVSAPGLLAPVEQDGMRLVDGGLLNNLPVDVVKQMGADVVLAVDVNGRKESIWQSLARLQPLSSTMGGLIMTLGDSLDVLVRQQRVYKLRNASPEFLIQPNIPAEVTILTGYDRVAELITQGEEATRPVLPALEEMLQPHWDWLFTGRSPHRSPTSP